MPPPAAPTSTKEQVGAALQTAGQYAGGSTIWTPGNAEALGLDPERGYIAKGTPTDQPQPTLEQLRQELQQSGALPKPVTPTIHPGLHGFTNGEQAAPSPQSQQPGPVPSPLPEPPVSVPTSVESDIKGAISEEEHAKEEKKGKAATSQLEGAVSEEEHAKEGKSPPQLEGAVSEEEHAKEAAAAPAVQAAAPPAAQPAPAVHPAAPAPQQQQQQPIYPQIAEDQPDTQEQLKTLVAQGHSPGAAQAIVAGQQPKTISGAPPKPAAPKAELVDIDPDKPYLDYLARAQGYRPGMAPWEQETAPTAPKQQLPQPIDSLKADDKNRVDPVSLYSYLLGKFAHSGVVGHVPPDGERWGIKTGSAAEWAAFALAVAKQESDLNARSTNLADPGGSYGLFQFSQKTQPQFTNGEDQYDPQHSADAFVRAVEQLVGPKGKIDNLGVTFGSIRRPNEAGQYIAGAQKVAAGGSGKDLVSSGGDGGSKGAGPAVGPGGPAGPWISVGGAPSGGAAAPAQFRAPSEGGGGGPQPDYSPSESRAEPISLAGVGGLLAGAAAGALRGGQQAPQPSEEKGPSPSDVVTRVLAAGGPPPAPGAAPVDLSTMKQANVLGVRTLGAPQLGLPAPPTAPGPDPIVIKGLMKRGFTREQALAFAAKASVSKPGAAAIAGGASFRKPAQLPAPAPPPAPAAKPQPVPAQPQAPPPRPVPSSQAGVAPRGSTVGVAKPQGSEALEGVPLAQVVKQHATLLSPDDPRVKKQADGMFKGEHFVPGDPVHDPALAGLPGGHGGRQRQILGEAEQAIAEKRPLHISYISAPQEAAKFPTRESRKIQYDEHSPEARLMGTTEGQLVGHSMIPVSVGIKLPKKAGEPHQSYIQGLSTNVLANNFAHINTKLAAMGQKTPYAKLGAKFANDLEGYLSNLIAGHTGTGRGYAVGTPEYPSTPDESHVPYRLSRREADFLNTVINNTGAFAKHEDGQALRELARANGTLITPEGETNRMRHEMEQHEPGWRQRVLEPSIRSFKTGLIHEVHPSEEHLPATIRPGQEYRDLTAAMARTSYRGRPDVPVSVSLHHTFADNKAINQIERDFSEERISEAEARARLHELGEDPRQYRFVGGSGGLITPYEENPEAITPEEHSQLKDNLRKQWIGGKMPIEDYRRKAAEVPLPEIPKRTPPATSGPSEEEETASPASGLGEEPEKVRSAAMRIGGKHYEGSIHADALENARTQGAKGPYESGFTTNKGRFVSAEEAWNLGKKNKQLKEGATPIRTKKGGPASGLTSADLKPEEAAPTEPSETEPAEEPVAAPPTSVKQRGFKAYKEPPKAVPKEKPAPPTGGLAEYNPREKEMFESALKNHGETNNIFDAGYILPSGKMLNFNRTNPYGGTTHEDIKYEGAATTNQGKDARDDFVRAGAVKINASGGAAAVGHKRLTGSQQKAIKDAVFSSVYPGFHVDIMDKHGKNSSFDIDENHPGKVLGEIESRQQRIRDQYKAEEPPEAETPTEAPARGTVATPPAPGDVLPPAKAKKPAKTKEDKAAEAEDLRQAALDRNDISETDTKQLNRLQRVAKGWIKQNPELHPLSAHTYLTGQKAFPNQGQLTKTGIGEHFDADNPKLDFENEEHREHAAGGIVHDIMHALAGTKTGKPSTAYGWYDRAVRKTLAKVGQIAPKILSDPEHGLAFKLGTAITSQGQDVFPNAVSGWQVYRHWLKNGELPTDAKVFGGGPKADAMVQNFAKVNNLWKELGTDGLQKLLTTKKTVRELRDKYGLDIDEPLDTKVPGAMALGPKIGAFFSNLHGNFDPTTIDMWFSRTMNRLGGNMFGFSDKAMRQDRMEKGKVVKSHLSDLSDLLNGGQLSGVDQNRAQKMQRELAALKAHPQGQLTRAKALQLAPEIHNWAQERRRIYEKSYGPGQRSYHPDFKTPENVLGKKLHEGVNELSDVPRTTSERRHWHDIMARVDTQLRNAGVKLTNADKQALLWFVEKDLFRQGGSNSRPNADYLDASYRLVRKVKSGELPGAADLAKPVQAVSSRVEPSPGEPRNIKNTSIGRSGVLKMDKGGVVPGLGGVLRMDNGGTVPTMDARLADLRARYAAEFQSNPDLARKFLASMTAEVGDLSPDFQQGYVEAVMNRAAQRHQTLDYALSEDHSQWYGTGADRHRGYYDPRTIAQLGKFFKPSELASFQPLIDNALAGSNKSNYATGNESDEMNSGPTTLAAGDKHNNRLIIEQGEQKWAKGMTSSPPKAVPVPQQPFWAPGTPLASGPDIVRPPSTQAPKALPANQSAQTDSAAAAAAPAYDEYED